MPIDRPTPVRPTTLRRGDKIAIYSARSREPKRGTVRMILTRSDGSVDIHTAAHGVVPVPPGGTIDAYSMQP